MTKPLNSWIYKSPLKNEMYLYLAEEEGFDAVPKPLLERFGRPVFVMELALHPGRKLAREEATKVMENLTGQGFHLQMPPDLKPDVSYGNDL